MKPLIICINGPRHSGKDTLALALRMQWLAQGGHATDVKFATPIEAAVAAMLPGKMSEDFTRARHDPIVKTQPNTIYDGSPSAVELLIGLSELFAKPVMGLDIFGILAAHHVKSLRKRERMLITVSDCGFQAEYNAFVGELLNEADVWLVQLYRDGYEFGAGDSRHRVQYNGKEAGALSVINGLGTEDLVHRAADIIAYIAKCTAEKEQASPA